MQTMRQTISMCRNNGILSLTLYDFSTENWKRPQAEVDYIISLVSEFVQETNVRELNENNIKVSFIGDIAKFPKETQQAMHSVVNQTQENTGLWFTDEMWPDFNEELLYAANLDYQNRMKRHQAL